MNDFSPPLGAQVSAYLAEAVVEGPTLTDITIVPCSPAAGKGGRPFLMLGPGGPERELSILPPELGGAASGQPAGAFDHERHLPVLIGSGMGFALGKLVQALPVPENGEARLLIVDKEKEILRHTALKERFASVPGLVWVDETEAGNAVKRISQEQGKAGGKAFFPIVNPCYTRLDRVYYSTVADAAKASRAANFWEKSAYRKFRSASPRIMLLTSQYFLIGEIKAACERLGLEHHLLQVPEREYGRTEFVEDLLSAVVRFKPDFVLTINHLGVDREGILISLLERLELPLASWFVDNPHLVLHLYEKVVSPWTALFTWDEDTIDSLRGMGFRQVSYLPLGVDHTRFLPPAENPAFIPNENWRANVSFVGNSMLHKVDSRVASFSPPADLKRDYRQLAAEFGASETRSVREWLQVNYPSHFAKMQAELDVPDQLSYEVALTWEATLQYRLSCVRAILPFNPLIVGDDGWLTLLKDVKTPWSYHKELAYYTDLPNFYPLSAINFNCTSKQMKGAVNQRVFDVPAAGAFLLTDWREQLGEMFEPGREVVCYHSPEEAEDLAGYYLNHPEAREKIALAARARVLRDHTYDQRLRRLVEYMRSVWG